MLIKKLKMFDNKIFKRSHLDKLLESCEQKKINILFTYDQKAQSYIVKLNKDDYFTQKIIPDSILINPKMAKFYAYLFLEEMIDEFEQIIKSLNQFLRAT